MGPKSIFDLLGLRPDVDAAHLRTAYEIAVASATQRNDWSRAAELSAAFDQLPIGVRTAAMHALYPGSGEVRIPRNAIVDAHGRALVLCPSGSTGRSWQPLHAMSGQNFTCPSGYVGVVRVPA